MSPKEELFAIMDAVPSGYDSVKAAIIEGRIDPVWPNVSIYGIPIGCFKAHLADHLKCKSVDLPGIARLKLGSYSVLEKYTSSVRTGDTPSTFPVMKDILDWLEEWNNSGCELDDEGSEL